MYVQSILVCKDKGLQLNPQIEQRVMNKIILLFPLSLKKQKRIEQKRRGKGGDAEQLRSTDKRKQKIHQIQLNQYHLL